MKTLLSIMLVLVLTASLFVGCGCTNQKMDNTSAPTVLPTNEELWNTTETTGISTEATMNTTNGTIVTETTEETRGINETEVQNKVNAHTEMMDKIRDKEKAATNATANAESPSSRMMPGTR